jgi:dihydrofolate reductase
LAKVLVVNHVTLDGVMQAPGRADEDRRGGFEHGGWAVPNNDPVMARVMADGMARRGSLLLGRRTYEQFFGFWPKQTDNPYTDVLNNVQKYVASRTLREPLPWSNSTLLEGDAADAVAALKQQSGDDLSLTILGSGELIQALMRRELIDEFLLMIHPLVLGSGRPLFPEGASSAFTLRDSVPTTKGVIIATYRPVASASHA